MKLIAENGALAACCRTWRACDYIAIDTEFMREKTFWPVLCLVQIAGGDEAAAIDPLADGIDLAPLFELLGDTNVLKVMHGGRQDIEIFHHLTGALPAPVYDTQIAAMVCGFGDQVGFETLIAKLTGTRLDKGSRFTDWSLRPLSDKQLRYALDDVIHLLPAYEALREQIAANGRESWLAEEMAALTDPALYEIDPQQSWRRFKPKSTSRRFLAVLKEVAAWREEEALARDVPRNRILRDETLTQIAAHPPPDPAALGKVRGVSKGFADSRQGKALMAAIARGTALPLDAAPAPVVKAPRPAGQGALVDLLKVLLKRNCEIHHVAQKLVASGGDLEEIAAHGEAAEVPAMKGWRRQVFGDDALRLQHGEIALAASHGRIDLVVPGARQADDADRPRDGRASAGRSAPGRRRGRRRRPRPRVDIHEVLE